MANLNKVFLIGNLTRDPELRYVPSGTAVASFGLATNRTYKTSSGETKKDTCFVKVVAWGRTAEVCGEYLSKGSPVFVEGRLQYRAWDSPNGEKRNTLEVQAERIQFIGRTEKAGGAQAGQAHPEEVEDVNLDSEAPEPNTNDAIKTKTKEDEVPF